MPQKPHTKTITIIIQARSGSSRLPHKVYADICGKPLIAHVISRAKANIMTDSIILATTTIKDDEKLLQIAENEGIAGFAGSPDDVLDRYYRAAKKTEAQYIIRITGDCPLIDPQVIDEVIAFMLANKGRCDYVATPHTYPEGLDVEIFTRRALETAWKNAVKKSEREHVTPYIKNHPELFQICGIGKKEKKSEEDFSSYHWSVDKPQDMVFVRAIYRHLYKPETLFYKDDVIKLLKEQPELLEINKGLTGYEGYAKSVKEDINQNRKLLHCSIVSLLITLSFLSSHESRESTRHLPSRGVTLQQ